MLTCKLISFLQECPPRPTDIYLSVHLFSHTISFPHGDVHPALQENCGLGVMRNHLFGFGHAKVPGWLCRYSSSLMLQLVGHLLSSGRLAPRMTHSLIQCVWRTMNCQRWEGPLPFLSTRRRLELCANILSSHLWTNILCEALLLTYLWKPTAGRWGSKDNEIAFWSGTTPSLTWRPLSSSSLQPATGWHPAAELSARGSFWQHEDLDHTGGGVFWILSHCNEVDFNSTCTLVNLYFCKKGFNCL